MKRHRRIDLTIKLNGMPKTTVPATTVGPYLAYHREHTPSRAWKRSDGYAISHLPSGLRVCSAGSAYEARTKAIALATLDLDWSVDDPSKVDKATRESVVRIIRSTHPRYTDRKYVERTDEPVLGRMERTLRFKAVEYAVGRAIFCPSCKSILDARRAVLVTGPNRANVACAPCFDAAAKKLVGSDPLRMRDGWEIDDGRELT